MKTVRGIASMPLVLKKVIHMKAVLAVVLAAVLFAGCGDGSAAPELTPIPTATTAPTPTPIPMLELGSVSVAADVEELTAADAALQELLDAASFFTGLHRMDVSDCGFDTGELLRLQEAYPETEITARLTLYGQEFLTDAVELDFSGTVIEDTTELEAMLPLMHKLEKVIMSDCGLSNEEMDALNKRHEDVRFVWTVYFGRCYYLRTDETAFIGSLFQGSTMNYSVLYDKDAEVLKYCEDMVALDLGHMQLTNCEFVRNMPHLRYLILADNPMQDIPLLAALKMPPFSLSDAELAAIRTAKTGKNVPYYEAFAEICTLEGALPEKCRAIWSKLEEWRFQAEAMRLSDFIWHVMQSSGYYAAVGALPKGELRQANLRMLYQRAQAFENDGGETLADFLRMTDEQSAGDDRMSAKMLGENENLLRIMTMHKSKGLEFPVVFCMQMSGGLHKPFRGELLLHTRLGAAMPYVNRELRIKRKTLADRAFKVQRELDEKAERARLLYVAMTRARERLIMIGCCKQKDRDVWRLPPSDYAVWNARSMTDWIMQAVQEIHNLSTDAPQPENPWNIRALTDLTGVPVDNNVDKSDLRDRLQGILSTPAEGDFSAWERSSESHAAPLKTSVSAIARKDATGDPMPLTDAEEDASTKRVEEEIVSPLRMSELPSKPAFLEEKQLTGAERGTLMHRALSLIQMDGLRGAENLYAAVKQAVHDLADREVFTYQEVMVLYLKGLADFFRSDLGQRMLHSPVVRREWAFNLVIEGGSLLQGVIDCAFQEDGAWVLVDYKTDRIADEEAFRQRYAKQIDWYARALESITGLPVREKYLYSISLNRAFPMT